ncbi:MAG: extracellular solute-binding protein [Oscillospiraceae bacterium]|nr:extracellular solute-binding protein [Oscillospiraceae bacterium]
MLKRVICSVLLLSFVLTLAGCNKKIEDDGEAENISHKSEETLAPFETMPVVLGMNQIRCFSRLNDEMILIGKETIITSDIEAIESEEGYTWIHYDSEVIASALIFNSEGDLLNKIILPEYYLDAVAVDSEGIWVFDSIYSEGDGNTKYFLICLDFEGNEVRKFEVALEKLFADDKVSPIAEMIIGDDGNFYMLFTPAYTASQEYGEYFYIVSFDRNGNILFEIKEQREYQEQMTELDHLTKLQDGRIVVFKSHRHNAAFNGEEFFIEIDPAQKGYGNRKWNFSQPDKIQSHMTISNGGGVYDFLVKDRGVIYGYKIETGESTELVNWAERGIYNNVHSYDAPYQFAVLFGDEYIFSFLENKSEDGDPFSLYGVISLVKLPIAKDRQVSSNKKNVTAATLGEVSDSVKNSIAEFNKQSEEYNIQIKTYEGDISDIINAFNIDIASGRAADIILTDNSHVSLESYASKGLFADLYEFMDNDPDFDRDDYLPNVFKGLETDGKLFIGANSFYISTLIGKTEIVGENKGWTWDEYNALLAKQPTGITPIANEWDYITNKNFLEYMLYSNMSEFVDFKAGTCSFESTGFIELLKAADSYPAEPDRVLSPDAYRAGNPLLMQVNVASFVIHKIFETARFGGDITFIGFPAESGNGSYGRADSRFAILKNANEPQGAREFVKYLLTDFQETAVTPKSGTLMPGFPVRTSTLERLADKAKNAPAFDFSLPLENGGELLIEIEPNTDADNQKVFDLIDSITDFTSFDITVASIVQEEAAYYFSNQKSAEEVSAIIQNRVGLYLAGLG